MQRKKKEVNIDLKWVAKGSSFVIWTFISQIPYIYLIFCSRHHLDIVKKIYTYIIGNILHKPSNSNDLRDLNGTKLTLEALN